MSLTIGAPVALSSSQNSTTNNSNVAPNLSSAKISESVNKITPNSNNLLTPSPIIQVNQTPELDESLIESPYIKVTEQLADKSRLKSQNYAQPDNLDKTPQQIRSLTEQQQNIQTRQEQLQNQELEIDREISELRQKELEVNRKKFQLQQQSTGNLLNIRV